MNFSEIKADSTLYLFDREHYIYNEIRVSSVGLPRYENKLGQRAQMVVDITAVVNDKPITYSFPESASKHYVGTLLISTDKSDVISDVKSLRFASERALNDVEKHRNAVSACKSLLADLDTEYKEKQASERRFQNIESSIEKMMTMLTKLTE